MNVLLICNYQREIPPFMITQIKIAEKYFDRIEYVNPSLLNDNSSCVISDNVYVYQIIRKRNIYRIIRTAMALFRKEVLVDIKKAVKEKKCNRAFLLHLFKELYPSEVLYKELRDILKTKYQNDMVCVLAVWFDCNAYAVARLKEIFPSIKAISFAHAFEVNPERSPFINVSLNLYKHENLDRVTFISKKVLNSYLNLMGYQKEKFLKKIDVCYLGSLNRDSYLSAYGVEKLHLCSCAGLTEVKRVDLILDALENWIGHEILWTHIGAGPLYERIRQRAEKINENNPYVEIHLAGKMDNKEVHEYYKKEIVDLFINVSSSEGLPVSVMEAISYGIPVIATNVGGTSEIVTAQNGFLINRDLDGEIIRNMILKYMNLSFDKKEKLREGARRVWKEKFNSEKTLAEYFEGIKMMMEGKLALNEMEQKVDDE